MKSRLILLAILVIHSAYVIHAQTVSPNNADYAFNEPITIHFSDGPGNALDWIGIYKSGDPDGSYLDWYYVNNSQTGGAGISDGSITFAAGLTTAGSYEVRFFQDNGYILLGNSSFTVTNKNVPVTGVSVTPATATIGIARNVSVTAITTPAWATNNAVTWSSSNTSVATVNASGIVTGVSNGIANITVTTVDGGYTASCEVTVLTTAPYVNYALQMDGNDNYPRNQMGKLSQWSLEAWIKGDDASWKAKEVIFGGGGYAGSDEEADVEPVVLLNGKLYSTKANITSAVALDANWHHVAATCDGTTTKIYLDGVEVGSTNSASPTIPAAVGSNWSAATTFGGQIDEVRIWNKALFSTEISTWMNKPLQATHTSFNNLKAYYTFDDKQTDLAINMVGKGHAPAHLIFDKVDKYGTNPLAFHVVNNNAAFSPPVTDQEVFSAIVSHSEWDVDQGSVDNQVLKLRVVVAGASNPFKLDQLVLSLSGTTNLADIANVHVYYSGKTASSPVRKELFGAGTAPGATMTFTESMASAHQLTEGVNYFLVTFDMKATATEGNVADANVTSFKLSGTTQTPVDAPTLEKKTIVKSSANDANYLRVLAWNIWHGGNHVGYSGPQITSDIAKATNADVILMQEAYGTQDKIATDLGYNLHTPGIGDNLALFSRWPITTYDSNYGSFNAVGAQTQIANGRTVALFSWWLRYATNPEYTVTYVNPGQNTQTWINDDRSKADTDAKGILTQDINAQVTDPDMPVILGGDFNSCSHLDWTANTTSIHHGYGAVNFPTSNTVINDGYNDTYRTINPDELTHPGGTWAVNYGYNDIRIDFIYHKGPNTRPTGAKIIRTPYEIDYIWPGDHAAVLTTYDMSTATPPVANFTGTPASVSPGQSVSFEDASTNAPTTWNWTFEGGSPATSTLQNPTVTYPTEGTFDVSLTVTNASGSDTKSEADYITVAPDTGKEVSFMQFNVWQEGTSVTNGMAYIKNVIAEANPDIVCFTEVRNYSGDWTQKIIDSLATVGLTYNRGYLSGADVSIISKYPITASGPFLEDAVSLFNVDIDGSPIVVGAAHLDYTYYACYLPRGYSCGGSSPYSGWDQIGKPNPRPVTNLADITAQNLGSQRDEQIAAFLAQVAGESNPVILMGDFNEPSHQDWTANQANMFDHNGVVMEWHSTKSLIDNGFTDAFREVYPDEVVNPGITWPAVATGTGSTSWTPKSDERDRIDYIFHKGTNVTAKSAAIVGPKAAFVNDVASTANSENDNFVADQLPWPSDHKAVLATISIPTESDPLVTVTGVSVTPTGLALNVGNTDQLTEMITPANATNKSVIWSANNVSVATVNTTGLVTAVGEGSATITVTTVDGGFTATSAITVSAAVGPAVVTSKATYNVDEDITVNFFNGPNSAKDWIGLHNAGTVPASGNSIDWLYVDGTTSGSTALSNGSVTFSSGLATVGSYNVNFLENDGFTVLATTSFTVTSGGGSSDTEAPTAPSSLVVTKNERTAITLEWSASTDNVGVAGYNIYEGSTLKGTTTDLSYKVTGLERKTNYTFYVEAFDAAGNTSAQSSLEGNTKSTQIEEVDRSIVENIQVYPNPTEGLVHILCEGYETFSYKVMNVYGQVILQEKDLLNKKTIDLSTKMPGVYLIAVDTGSKTNVYKIIRQ